MTYDPRDDPRNDTLAQLLCQQYSELDDPYGHTPDEFYPEADWLRSHRRELLEALGGDIHYQTEEVENWVFRP